MNNRPVYLLALLLTLVGLSLGLYKWKVLNLPLTAGEHTAVWTIEARASFDAQGKVKARLLLPQNPPGFEVIDENFVSRDFGLTTEVSGQTRQALWSIRRSHGLQSLYYRLSVNPRNEEVTGYPGRFPGYPEKPDYPELYRTAIESLLDDVRAQSADIASFTRQLVHKLNSDINDPAVKLLQGEADSESEWVQQLVYILAGARIPARVVYGLPLRHGVLDARLQPWLEVHNETQWLPFNPRTGEQRFPERFLIWKTSGQRTLDVEGAKLPELRFSIRRGLRDTLNLARESNSPAVAFSLLGLPLYVQNVYTVLLTVPLGAFLVVLLRNLIGIKTFGTFMPVLIALAFRETELLWGVVLFSVLVALGLLIRLVLEHLKLLLVPRLAAVLIIVILLMLCISIASYRLGFEHGLSVALFPMVIMAMTIERMSIVWEEHGAREALIQGMGSLMVATLAFLVMNADALTHIVALFPEFLLLVLAATLLLGRYTGYRLSELWRFRSVWMKQT